MVVLHYFAVYTAGTKKEKEKEKKKKKQQQQQQPFLLYGEECFTGN